MQKVTRVTGAATFRDGGEIYIPQSGISLNPYKHISVNPSHMSPASPWSTVTGNKEHLFLKAFVRGLEKAGISFSHLNGGLKLSAPTGVVTSDILAEIKKNKFEIIEFLSNTGGVPMPHRANVNTHLKPTPAPTGGEKSKPSPVALAWLLAHRQELDDAGWTRSELYRRNKSPGLSWISLWQRTDLEISLLNDGIILFYFKDGGAPQTARPKKHISLIGV